MGVRASEGIASIYFRLLVEEAHVDFMLREVYNALCFNF
jgi:hypothetical protein